MSKQKFQAVKSFRKVRVITEGESPYGRERKIPASSQYVCASGLVTVEFDIDALLKYMGERASATKSGISKFQDGLITARFHADGNVVAASKVMEWSEVKPGTERKVNEPLPFTE